MSRIYVTRDPDATYYEVWHTKPEFTGYFWKGPDKTWSLLSCEECVRLFGYVPRESGMLTFETDCVKEEVYE